MMKLAALLFLLIPSVCSFVNQHGRIFGAVSHQRQHQHGLNAKSEDGDFLVTLDMPPSNSGLQANLKIAPVLSVPSEIVAVRYKLPFGLDVAPQNGLAVCTKDGAGGEKVGDVLRYTSQWAMGLPQGDGLITQAAAFSGGVSWQCSLFNVIKAGAWEEVVEALTSNVESRTDEVLLVFERPLE